MKKQLQKLILFTICILNCNAMFSIEGKLTSTITIKTPGNPSESYSLQETAGGILKAGKDLPIRIKQQKTEDDSHLRIILTLEATDVIYYSFENLFNTNFRHTDCLFYMPGFWYRHNLRSPKEAPSFHTSDSWHVKEDRLSTPLTGIFDEQTGSYYTVLRMDEFKEEALACHTHGEVILSGKTSLGYTGFRNINGISSLVFGYPYSEAPKAYIRKLTLAPAIQTFDKLEKGEKREIVWEVKKGSTPSYSSFVADVWNYSHNAYKPTTMDPKYTLLQAKNILTDFFVQSYVEKYPLKYFSGVELRTDDCESTGIAEIGFVGRVLLNAFNALEYGEENNRPDLVEKASAVFNSYLEHGFTSNGFFREVVDYHRNNETHVYSIRRQSEGVYAILYYLNYEKKKGRKHPQWENKITNILDNFLRLQKEDGSFPRKFDDSFKIVDESGGSTPSATLPLAMAYTYFKNKSYLESAKKTAGYLETNLISKADYFSSTLDANCEDKEASLYASTAMYYMAMVSKGKEKQHYIDMAKESAYFALSWYYMWDVPFAQGQMLGDVGFKSRGWGNVSVENNHIDVFIFEFATVLEWLAKERNEPAFSQFSDVIKTSMLQLMPVQGEMFNIGKTGYYPEVVQHTNWDYGRNGKGFYNNIFAPGWTVASLWQMLSPDRTENFFIKK